jgi:hypothetical protein
MRKRRFASAARPADYGFPRWRGGPMHYADANGLDDVLAGMRKYGEQLTEPVGPVHRTPARTARGNRRRRMQW